MAAHRYWRFGITSGQSPGSQVNSFEFEMRTTPGGADVCSGGTAFASSGTAANAFDNNDSTNWESGSNSFPYTHYVGYDFGSGNAVDIVEVALMRGTYETENVRDFLFQYSDDNATWTTQASIGPLPPFNITVKTLAVIDVTPKTQIGRRYWRFLQSSSVSSGTQNNIKKIEFRDTVSGPHKLVNGVVTASNALSNGARAISAHAQNWETTYGGNPAWVAYALPAGFLTKVVEVAITGGTFASENPKNFKIQFSDDGAAWIDAFDHVAPGGWAWATDEVKTFTMSDDGYEDVTEFKYWRLLGHNAAGTQYMGLAELRLYDAANNPIAGGTPTASTEFSSTYNAPKARDANAATAWSTTLSQNINAWLLLTFPSAKLVTRFELEAPAGSSRPDAPSSFELQRSSDGTNFTTVRRFNHTWASNTVESFSLTPSVDVDVPYWRVVLFASADTYASIAEIEWLDSTNTPITGGTAFADTNFSGSFDAPKSRDGNASTYWSHAAGYKVGSWLAVNFGADKAPASVRIKPPAASAHVQGPTSFVVECSLDGRSWDAVQAFSTTWSNDTAKTFVFGAVTPTDPVRRRYPIVN